jgi:acyl-CoA synthetase (AMP-forming)/AMP-acid ligase II
MVTGLPEPAALTIPAVWRAIVEAHGERELVRKDGRSHSFADIDRRAGHLARGLLAAGASKGTRIGILMANGPDWMVSWLAVSRIGGLAILLSTFSSARELAYGVRHADVALLLCDHRLLRHDYVARLEEAFPSLGDADGGRPLALPECPYLRHIWINGAAERPWMAGTLAGLEAEGAHARTFDAGMLAAVEAAVFPADLALLMYTSGSTADPKGVVHSHGAAARQWLYMSRGNGILPNRSGPDDRIIVSAPFFWVGGLLAMMGAMTHGGLIICVDDHAPAVLLQTMRDNQVTQITGSDAALRALRDSPAARPGDFDRLRPANTNQMIFFNRDPNVASDRFALSLGMTETFGPHSGLWQGGLLPPEAAGSVGPALAFSEYKIVDPETGAPMPFGEPGELCVRTPHLMQGMYKKERAQVFDADGFYHTGDECVLRADGYLFYRQRLGGMIKTSGANVSPEEVELAIRADDDVIEAAVFGLPDPKLGEMVVAVVAKTAGSDLDEAALQARLRPRLSSFKVPKRVFFLDPADLPRTPSNKIRKPPLARMVAGMIEGVGG